MFKKFFQNKGFHLNGEKRESPVAQQVKDLALSLGLLGSLAWELPHTTGMAKKKKSHNFIYKNNRYSFKS